MIRHAAAVIVGLCLSVPPLSAQTTTVTLKVSATAAAVHKAPTLASPVIGKALRGTDLAVTREIGDWVKVSWPTAPDGVGYVRTNVGTIARDDAGVQTNARAGVAAGAPAAPAPTSTPVPDQAPELATATPSSAPTSPASAPTLASAPAPTPKAAVPASPVPAVETQSATAVPARTIGAGPTRGMGVGIVGGSTPGFGASARVWSKGSLGAQLQISRHSFNSTDLLSRATATDIAPSLLFSMRDHLNDRLWWRPYVGLAGHYVHASRTDLIFLYATETASTFGGRVFAGAEMAFARLPQFTISADAGYYHLRPPFVGLDPSGVGFALSGHWYVR
jgi:Bacterial SH3 domain